MRWEDQELNYAVPETKFPEVLEAMFALLDRAERAAGRFIACDATAAAALPLKQFADRGPARIDRLSLHLRLACRISPGGGPYAELGVFHYWSGKMSMYAIVHVSPTNDWFELMCVAAPEPNKSPETNALERQ